MLDCLYDSGFVVTNNVILVNDDAHLVCRFEKERYDVALSDEDAVALFRNVLKRPAPYTVFFSKFCQVHHELVLPYATRGFRWIN